jgi:flagellar hook-associated protein 1 FlgK
VLSSAQVLTQSLNGMTAQIQALRSDAEGGLANAVSTANTAMQKIAELNGQIGSGEAGSSGVAALEDQRDSYIDQLAELMDIRVVNDNNQVNVFTNSGIQLVGAKASQLSFTPQGTMSAATQWNADPAQSTLGSVVMVTGNGASYDLIANNSIRSGTIAAYVDMRDNVLVQAQSQLDALAASMSKALSDQTVPGTAASSGAQNGFDIDTSGLLNGNSINLTYTDVSTGTQHHVTIMRVDDPAALPLDNSATADPNDEVVGVDFSGGLTSVAAQLNAQIGGGSLQFSDQGGSTLRVLDDGTGSVTVDALSLTQTASSLLGGSGPLPFFTDGPSPYTGAITSLGSQSVGFAGRIGVNPALLLDPSKLVLYDANTAAGDSTRPDFIYQQLTGALSTYSPDVGFGSASSPFTGSLPSFLRQTLSMQGEAAANATSLSQGQDVVVNALKQRMEDKSGVNVDQEMANLISLQTAYGANARVMSVVKDMLDTLMRM